MKKIFIIALVFFAAAVQICLAQAQKIGSLSFTPSSGSFESGYIIEVAVNIDTGSEETDGVDILYVSYPKDLLEVQDADNVLDGVQISPGNLYPQTVYNKTDIQKGQIGFSQVTIPGGKFKGSGVLATIKFKALGPGTANLSFESDNCNIAAAGGIDILGQTGKAEFVLTGEPVNQAPIFFDEHSGAEKALKFIKDNLVLIGLILFLIVLIIVVIFTASKKLQKHP